LFHFCAFLTLILASLTAGSNCAAREIETAEGMLEGCQRDSSRLIKFCGRQWRLLAACKVAAMKFHGTFTEGTHFSGTFSVICWYFLCVSVTISKFTRKLWHLQPFVWINLG